jgi:hypothetical protein
MDRFSPMTTHTKLTSSSYLKEDQQNVVVAILCSDLKMGKQLSDIFKKVGVHPYVCTDLAQFWSETLKETPHLALVDVKLMSEGNYLFKEHPKVKNKEMPVSFYFDGDSSPLLYSTYDILNLGYIDSRISLTGQVKAVLKRFNSYQSWQSRAQSAWEAEEQLDGKLSHIVKKTEELKEKTFYQSYLKSLQGRLEVEKDAEDFQTAVARVFSQVKELRSFTFLELSPSGQKLISPKFQFDKYVDIPSLWLGKTCPKGIEFFAQNMASQICLEIMGGELMSLLIRGRREEPDMMIFIRVEGEDFLANFDWESFERYLSGYYCYFGWRSHNEEGLSSSRGQSWELYNLLDEIKFGSIPESRVQGGYDRFCLVGIDFSILVERALGQEGMRFYWKKFYQDFVAGLETQKGISFRCFHHDTRHTFLLIEKDNLDNDLAQIKNYCLRYPFWRYFEDADVVLGASLKPDVRIVPMAPQAIERLVGEPVKTLVEIGTSTSTPALAPAKKKSFYHHGNDQSM